MSVLAAVKRANAKGKPEESVALRVAVLVTVLAATSAALAQGVGGPVLRVVGTAGIAAGFAYSHHARHRDGYALKIVLAIGVILAFGDFIGTTQQLGAGAVNEVQLPLAELFVWVQVLHSADVPARRDLLFSLLSSLVLMAVAGVLSLSGNLAPYVAVWAAASLASLVLAHRSELADRPRLLAAEPLARRAAALGPSAASRPPSASRSIAAVVAMAAVLAAAVFLVLPAAGAGRAIAFPARLPSAFPVPNLGGLANPSLGGLDPASPDGTYSSTGGPGSSTGYFGFSSTLDTAVRGRPDNTLVMRVRAERPDFWRGQTFDRWNGRTWSQTDQRVRAVGGETPIRLRGGDDPISARDRRVVQTVHVERAGPNLIFAANSPTDLYFSDRRVFEMSDGTVRTGVQLDKGAVYTVVSARSGATADLLRSHELAMWSEDSPEFTARYTALPPDVPERVLSLAADLDDQAAGRYELVRAIESWMADNTVYSLDTPPLPRGADAVEQFLFEDQVGFCEQIASSMVVMLRSRGVPARLAVGYAPGTRNPFTGMWEVRASDAHAWTEVWFPGYGWQSFDPTAEVPLSGDSFSSSAAAGLLDYVAKGLPSLPPGFAPVTLGVVSVLGLVLAAGWMVRRALGRRRFERARPWADVALGRLEDLGARAGRPRRASEPPSAYADTLARSVLPDPRVRTVAAAVEADAFGPDGVVGADERRSVDAMLDELAASTLTT